MPMGPVDVVMLTAFVAALPPMETEEIDGPDS